MNTITNNNYPEVCKEIPLEATETPQDKEFWTDVFIWFRMAVGVVLMAFAMVLEVGGHVGLIKTTVVIGFLLLVAQITVKNKDKFKLKEHEIMHKCPMCKIKTIHNKKGFRNHNYREECSICGNWYYAEYGF